MNVIETERLILRTWRHQDAEDYFRINHDPRVIEYLPGPLTMEEVHEFIQRMNQQMLDKNYTLWAAEEKLSGKLIGFIGLSWLVLAPPIEPSVEIGWRLGSEYWGKGYATEGARAVMAYGWNTCDLNEITAITVPDNHRSQRVMDKIGLKRDVTADFRHPRLPQDHRLSQHIFYRLKKE